MPLRLLGSRFTFSEGFVIQKVTIINILIFVNLGVFPDIAGQDVAKNRLFRVKSPFELLIG